MKIVSLITSMIILFLNGCTSSSKLKESRQFLKEYAFCKCFQYASAYTGYFIKDVSLSVYSDLASYNSTAYDKIDSLSSVTVAAFRPSEVADYKNKKAVFFDCFKFYKSKQLDSAIKKLEKEIRKGW